MHDCIDLYRILEASDLKTLRKFNSHLKKILHKFGAPTPPNMRFILLPRFHFSQFCNLLVASNLIPNISADSRLPKWHVIALENQSTIFNTNSIILTLCPSTLNTSLVQVFYRIANS